ncbi:MAG: ECF transporter S component [Microbacterium sp.]|uniref:ECF transporter S component n=1 Tax=Microbacterium sp. TaxID=51671 RepID=UPI0039E26C57
MHTSTSPSVRSARFRWRVVDIVVASVIGVAAGVIFWAWGQAWTPLSTGLAFLPGLEGLLSGGWLFAGVLGGLVIRKPGAALYTEIVAAVVSMAVGTQWGFETFIWGVLEGVGAEIGFAVLLYANWRLLGALVSGAFAGLSTAILDTNLSSIAAYDIGPRTVYFFSSIVSGILLAGLVSWLIVRALAATGALDRFAAGREARAADTA